MRQYLEAKRQHPLALVLFRMGDFYELFYEDALVAARALDLTLTSRSKDATGAAVPMCGVPHHAADGYITRLVRKGHRVAICEQVEDPRKAKGVVRREVVRVVSPGTLADAGYLDAREPAFLLAVTGLDAPADAQTRIGVALLDLSTGEFQVAEYHGAHARQALDDDVAVLAPREIVVASGVDVPAALPSTAAIPVTVVEGWSFDAARATETLRDQLRVSSLDGFGLAGRPGAVAAAGALVRYLRDTQKADLAHVRTLRLRESAGRLLVDPTTVRHLELVESSHGGRAGSLLDEIDRTVTPMGGRLMRAWLLAPLVTLEPIRDRLDAVEELAFRAVDRGKVRETLKTVLDLERLMSRVALATASPRDLVGLRQSLAAVPRLRLLLAECRAPLLASLVAQLDDLADVRTAIEAAIVDEPPAVARDGDVIRDGVDGELDELRRVSRSGKQVIAELEATERARTGIQSLKVRFNRVFGYYIEISKANLHHVPDDYIRKQTIAGGERFITPALKDYEEKVLGADERAVERELELFEALRAAVAGRGAAGARHRPGGGRPRRPGRHGRDRGGSQLHQAPRPRGRRAGGHRRASSRGRAAGRRHLRPQRRRARRRRAPAGGPDRPEHGRQVHLPAPGGAVCRCSPRPARSCRRATPSSAWSIASTRASAPRTTSAAASRPSWSRCRRPRTSCSGATSRSLVVLDEVGRGTATFDGLSIAWAVAEHLATSPRARPKTLFATHYHELTDLADSVPGVINAHVAVQEWKDDIVFLHKILPGRSDRSYGIHVARLAGLPPSVVSRARDILRALEQDELSRGGRPALSGEPARIPQQQLGLFQAPVDDALRARLRELDIDRTTPLDALRLLAELKRDADA